MAKNLVLIVNPPSPDPRYVVIRDVNRSGRMTRERMIWPQTNLAYIAAITPQSCDIKIIDCIAESIHWKDLEKIIFQCRPTYIIANAISTTLNNDMYIFFYAKSYGAKTIAMGPHVTYSPSESLKNYPCLDYIAIGEPELTLQELLSTLENQPNEAILKDIKGLAWRDGDTIAINEERPYIEDLNTLPSPRHDLLPLNKYKMPFFGNYTFIIAGRGCPFRCIFCRQNVMWKSHVRMRSGKSLFDETIQLVSMGVQNIMFQADTFTADRQIVVDLCNLLIEHNVKIKWACNTHISTIDRELATLMKKAGCWMIAPGIESCDDNVLLNIKKKISKEQIVRVVNMLHEVGIEVWGYFVFGLPGDSTETLRDTIHCALQLPLTMANFAVAAPYPGTPLYETALKEGWLIAKRWEEYDQNWSAVLKYPNLSPKQIIKFVKLANFRFYARPKQIKRICKELISNPRMALSLLHVVWDHLLFIFGVEQKRRT